MPRNQNLESFWTKKLAMSVGVNGLIVHLPFPLMKILLYGIEIMTMLSKTLRVEGIQ